MVRSVRVKRGNSVEYAQREAHNNIHHPRGFPPLSSFYSEILFGESVITLLPSSASCLTVLYSSSFSIPFNSALDRVRHDHYRHFSHARFRSLSSVYDVVPNSSTVEIVELVASQPAMGNQSGTGDNDHFFRACSMAPQILTSNSRRLFHDDEQEKNDVFCFNSEFQPLPFRRIFHVTADGHSYLCQSHFV